MHTYKCTHSIVQTYKNADIRTYMYQKEQHTAHTYIQIFIYIMILVCRQPYINNLMQCFFALQ